MCGKKIAFAQVVDLSASQHLRPLAGHDSDLFSLIYLIMIVGQRWKNITTSKHYTRSTFLWVANENVSASLYSILLHPLVGRPASLSLHSGLGAGILPLRLVLLGVIGPFSRAVRQ